MNLGPPGQLRCAGVPRRLWQTRFVIALDMVEERVVVVERRWLGAVSLAEGADVAGSGGLGSSVAVGVKCIARFEAVIVHLNRDMALVVAGVGEQRGYYGGEVEGSVT